MVRLRHNVVELAERVGFEPTVRFPARRISSAVLSTTQPPLRVEACQGTGRTPGVGRLTSSAVGACLAANPRAPCTILLAH